MQRIQQGFTLIELMIVIAIIGILAAVAIPAYQDYTIRAQVSEGMSLASASKMAASEYYNQNGSFPANNGQAGLAPSGTIKGEYVSSVGQAGGNITITYSGPNINSEVAGSTLVLSAITYQGSVDWNCKPDGGISKQYLPASCRD